MSHKLSPLELFLTKSAGIFIGVVLCGAITSPFIYVFSQLLGSAFPFAGEAMTLYQSFLLANFLCVSLLLMRGVKKP